MGSWILGAVIGVLSLAGLLVASRAHDQAFYWAGLVVFAAGVAVIFWLIAKHTGHQERQHDH